MTSNRMLAVHSKRKAFSLAVTAAFLAGCSSGTAPETVVPSPTAAVSLPPAAAAGAVNTYDGGQSPGEWTLALDHTNNVFSYQPVTYPMAAADEPSTGSPQQNGGFLSLGASGLAYEIPGRAAVLRPGDSGNSPVFAVPQTQCYAITGKLRFQYIEMYPGIDTTTPTSQALDPLGYGSIVASTDPTGKTWQFENLQGGAGQVQGVQLPVVFGRASFSGSCTVSAGQATISLPNPPLLDAFWAPGPGLQSSAPATKVQSKIWIGPSGFFAADQSDPTQPSTGASMAGLAEPSAALSTPALAAGKYLGFLHLAGSQPGLLAGSPAIAPFTAPVGFGQVVAGSGTTMTGGIFPGDNVAGTPNSDIQISLGTQDPTLNGLYPSVSITVLDPAQNCANFPGQPQGFSVQGVSVGVNAQGYATCTFPGVAVAGSADGKYAIFVSTYNWAANLGGAGETFFLFQQ